MQTIFRFKKQDASSRDFMNAIKSWNWKTSCRVVKSSVVISIYFAPIFILSSQTTIRGVEHFIETFQNSSVYLFVCLSVSLSVFVFFSLPLPLSLFSVSLCLSASLPFSLSLSIFVSLSLSPSLSVSLSMSVSPLCLYLSLSVSPPSCCKFD